MKRNVSKPESRRDTHWNKPYTCSPVTGLANSSFMPVFLLLSTVSKTEVNVLWWNTITCPRGKCYFLSRSINQLQQFIFAGSSKYVIIFFDCCYLLPSVGNSFNKLVSSLRDIYKLVINHWKVRHFTIWLCLTRTGNYQIHEFDWLKWILTAV